MLVAQLADEGRLHDSAVLKAQVKRMLASPRARALFDGFGAQWLGLDKIATKTFDPSREKETLSGEQIRALLGLGNGKSAA
jgi:hypothetical protein